VSDRLAIPEGDRLNLSDAWLRSTAAAFPEVSAIDATAPRRIYLDAACEIFALVSPEDYAWLSQWRWGWVWDRTKTKRYARRTPRGAGGKSTIGDHQNGESLDCQRGNMRWATRSMNRRNRKR
jgi:hypothetical protein